MTSTRLPQGELLVAFRGPNGWYAAVQGADGFHHQPANGGRHDSADEALAAALREIDLDPWDEDHWGERSWLGGRAAQRTR